MSSLTLVALAMWIAALSLLLVGYRRQTDPRKRIADRHGLSRIMAPRVFCALSWQVCRDYYRAFHQYWWYRIASKNLMLVAEFWCQLAVCSISLASL